MEVSRPTIKELQAEIKALKEQNNKTNEIPEVMLKLPLTEANNFVNNLALILVGDDRVIPIRHSFVEMIKRHNESNNEQSDK